MNTMITLSSLLLATSLIHVNDSQASLTKKSQGQIITFESDANGFNTKTFFYDNGEEVVAFDSQFTEDLAKKSIEKLRTYTKNPITHLVITHPNPDKFNGLKVFQNEGAKVITSQNTADALLDVHSYKKYYFVNMAKMFTEETYPTLGTPDSTFIGQTQLVLKNGEKIILQELKNPGVSSTQTVAYIKSQRALFVGDLVHHKAHAWLEGGIVNGKTTPNVDKWIAALKEIKLLFPKSSIVFGGRGQQGSLGVVVKEQIKYLNKAKDITQSYISLLGDKGSELKDEKAMSHYNKIQVLFENEFPEYSFGYMIGYGVYGLVNSFIK